MRRGVGVGVGGAREVRVLQALCIARGHGTVEEQRNLGESAAIRAPMLTLREGGRGRAGVRDKVVCRVQI